MFHDTKPLAEAIVTDIRYSISADESERFDTPALRDHFLVPEIFSGSSVRWTYVQVDRMMIGGCIPKKRVELTAEPTLIGGRHLLERRELGIFNLGGPAVVEVGKSRNELDQSDALYVGRSTEPVFVGSVHAKNPARLYFVSTPAHRSCPTARVRISDAQTTELGSAETCNRRTLRKYIFPGGAESCQLVMGFTTLHEGSAWNTMPCHTHLRRMETYLYFDVKQDAVVFHFMGRPDRTRHLVVRNEQAIISPPWSIHAGAGTAAYSFIWAMAGENQEFSDMDAVAMTEIA